MIIVCVWKPFWFESTETVGSDAFTVVAVRCSFFHLLIDLDGVLNVHELLLFNVFVSGYRM